MPTSLADTTPAQALLAGVFKESGLTSVDFTGSSIATISGTTDGTGAFQGCTFLKEVKIVAGVTAIQSYAFAGCTSLDTFGIAPLTTGKAIIPAGVATQQNAFYKSGIKDLTVNIDGSTSAYNGNAFTDSPNLAKVTFSNSNAFASITYALPSVTEIVWNLTQAIGSTTNFTGCSNLKTLTVSQELAGAVDPGAFSTANSKFTDLVIKANQTAGSLDSTFYRLPDSVTTVTVSDTGTDSNANPAAAYDVGSANNDDTPYFNKNVNRIVFTGPINMNEKALGGTHADALKDLTVSINAPIAGFLAVNGGKVKTLEIGEKVPAGIVTTAVPTFYRFTDLVEYKVISGNTYKAVDGVLLNGTGTELLNYPLKKVATVYEVPSSVTTIVASAITGASLAIEDLTVTSGVASILSGNFVAAPNLVTLRYKAERATISTTFPTTISTLEIDGSTVRSIPANFLGVNTALTEITIPYGVITVMPGAFSSISTTGNLKTVNLNANLDPNSTGIFTGRTSIENVNIGKDVNIIPNNAFYGLTRLHSIDLKGVSAIGSNAFQGCTLLNHLVIPFGVATISAGAFTSCDGLGEVTFYSSSVSIVGAFDAGTGGNSTSANSNGTGRFNNLSDALANTDVGVGGAGVYQRGPTPDCWKRTRDLP
jgi:hypothetical protein